MSERPTVSWVVSLLLGTLLAAAATGLTVGWMQRLFGPAASSAPASVGVATGAATGPSDERLPAAAPLPPPARSQARIFPWLPGPEADLPPDRLFERVDGAADALIAAGCERLVCWRVADPPAELDLLVFRDAAGAAGELRRDAGPGRTPGPGDEASVEPGSIYFRRGRAYVRLLADAGKRVPHGRLLDLAARLDAALSVAHDLNGSGS
jgi:hypothetical protein